MGADPNPSPPQDEDNYMMFNLKNKEFTFDVDVSKLPCGLNGALYFVQMDQDGGLSKYPSNTAGAKYGTGYCDAQARLGRASLSPPLPSPSPFRRRAAPA